MSEGKHDAIRIREMPALTLATARQTLWKYARGENDTAVDFSAATTADKAAVDSVINQVLERFITSGRWRGLEVRARFKVFQNQVTLPSTLDSLIGVTPIRSVENDQDFFNVSPLSVYSARHEFLVNGPGNPATYGMDGVVDLGNDFATFFEPSAAFTVKVTSEYTETGKTILLRGLDATNAQIYTGATEGEVLDVEITPGNTSTSQFIALSSWVKSGITNGVVKLYAVDVTTAEETLLVVIPPSKLVSGYHRYRVPTAIWGDTVECLCNRAHVPAVVDNDILPVANLGALKLGMMSLRFEDANDSANAKAYMKDAIELLNADFKKFESDATIAIEFNGQFGAGTIPFFI